MKLPKIKLPKLPKLITARDDGKKEFIGLTASEWGMSTGVLCALYAVLAGFFAVLLVIAQSIRNSGDIYEIPGSDELSTKDD